jgi:hypothetical protein
MTFIKIIAMFLSGMMVFCGNQKAGENHSEESAVSRPSMLGKTEDNTIKKPESTALEMTIKRDSSKADTLKSADEVPIKKKSDSSNTVEQSPIGKNVTFIKVKPAVNQKPRDAKKEVSLNVHLKKIEGAKVQPAIVEKSMDSVIAIRSIEPEKSSSMDCYSLTGSPLTRQEALECAKHHWKEAQRYYNAKGLDTAYLHCKKALSLFENGSLFTIKADIMNQAERYSESVQAAEISISRNDHWEAKDKIEAYRVRCSSLYVINKRFPSTEALNNYKKAVDEFEKAGRVSK